MTSPTPPAFTAFTAYAGFAAFGGFWGVWGASVPAVREQAGLSDGQLGTALLFVGAGALPAMLITGRAVDRWGHRLTAVLLMALGGAGVGVALTGQGFASLSVGLAVLGATSGAADVAINAAAGSAERASNRPVIARAHGVFSASVVVASLAGGALRSGGSTVAVPFLLAAAAAGIVALATARTGSPEPRPTAHPEPSERPWRRPVGNLRLLPLLIVGGLGAVAFAVENAHQTWSAVYLGDVLAAGPALAAAGPAVFAAVVALTRFAVAPLSTTYPCPVLVTGATAAAAGTTVVASAPSVSIALVGLGLAAAGTAVLYPTLLGLVAGQVDETVRGAATSVVATVAYIGFLAGPVYVGRWAAAFGLPGAMAAVAAMAAGLALLTWPALQGGRLRPMGWEPDQEGLRGRVAVVAGATRGAGRGIAAALGEAGTTVVCTGRSSRTGSLRSDYDRSETIEETAELVTELGGTGIAVPVDHLEPDQLKALAERIRAEHGHIDVLVNDIWGAEVLKGGPAEWNTPIWEHDLDTGLRILRLAIDTHLITSHHLLPLMIDRPGGLLVEMTDGTNDYNATNYRISVYYDLAKVAVNRLAFSQGHELARHGGTAVAITPGFLRSEMMLDAFGVTEETWRDAVDPARAEQGGPAAPPDFALSESPRYVGRAVVALATDPNRARWNQQSVNSGQLAHEYGFTDIDGSQPDIWRYIAEGHGHGETPTVDLADYR